MKKDPDSRLLVDIYSFLFRRRLATLLLALILFLIMLWFAVTIKLDENIMSIMPGENTTFGSYRRLLDTFDPLNKLYVDIGYKNRTTEADRETVIACADKLYQQLIESDYFDSIMYKWNLQDLTQTIDTLRQSGLYLLDQNGLEQIRAKLDSRKIHEQLITWKKSLTESPDPFLSRQFYADPLGLDEVFTNKLQSVNSLSQSITVYQGRLFSKKNNHALFIAKPKIAGTDSLRSQQFVRFMSDTIRTFAATHPQIQISYLSSHRFSLENADRIKADVQLTISLSTLAVILIAFFVFSRPYLIFLTLLPAIFGEVLAIFMLRWLSPGISAIIIGFGGMLIGIAVDYGIHFLVHIEQLPLTGDYKKNMVSLLTRLARPLLLCTFTTALAFLTLQLSVLPGYRQLGIVVIFGVCGAFLVTLFILPLFLLPKAQKPGVARPGWGGKLRSKLGLMFKKGPAERTEAKPYKKTIFYITGFVLRFIRFSHRHYIATLAVIGLISLGLFPGFMQVRFEGDMARLNASTPEIQADFERVLATVGDAASSTLVAVEGQDLEEALIKTEKLSALLKELKEEGFIKFYASPASVLPSRQQQTENNRRWQAYFNETEKAKLIADLKAAARAVRIREDFLIRSLKVLEPPAACLDLQAYEPTIFKDILANQIAASDHGYMTVTPVILTGSDNEHIGTIKDRLDAGDLQAIIYNGKYFTRQIIDLIFQEIKKISLIVILVVFLLLMVYNRNLLTTFSMLLPVLISLYWTFGIMGWLGIPINITNCLISVFVLGLVIDYSIFLSLSIDKIEDKSALEHLVLSYGAIIVSAFTTMASLGTLAAARHPALRSIGLATILAISCGLLAVLLIIPVIFRKKANAKSLQTSNSA